MVRAFVLIQAQAGQAGSVARALRRMEGISSAVAVTGPYDVIAVAEAASLDALGHVVVSQIQSVEGITRTLTCPVLSL
jgi:DNA-binding Lrp family transcriptional regulator